MSAGYGSPTAYRDDSAAPERTALAWQRTALALVVAAAVVGRLSYGDLGVLAVVGALVAAVAAVAVLASARWLQRPGARPGGTTTLTLALAVAGLGVLELLAALPG
ncbi:DUF202 domain-containing protein [Nocardioides sp. ChNu-153]|uniref:DUF202 domain-containing protein n=1 Tax=unclassified Nocardioides TaxID=2615069 RepID=UPI002405EF64|nr:MULTISPECIES: DUF202 domain-containing protein [unclassified Nocardioides]MDF9714681.1 DUF202 domain-containing protein [Nocardioides sp. ChNu-99]MDN7119786.1 DUF202 domain-containing protein [Nocardioides sp. ChNu-153]